MSASQQALPLGWFLLLALPVFAVCGLLWLFADGADRIEQALALLPTDDVDPGCTDPDCGCAQARQVHAGYMRLLAAIAEHDAWTERLRAVAAADAGQVTR